VGLDEHGHEKMKKRMSRSQVLKHFANHPACVVGMEACASSHYFARELRKLGHEAKLIPPQYVKAYVRGQKNDANDARAIAEALRVPSMRFVTVKTVAQQDVQSLIRLREGAINARTAAANRLRGLLGEYGLVRAKGLGALRRALPEILEDAEPGTTAPAGTYRTHRHPHGGTDRPGQTGRPRATAANGARLRPDRGERVRQRQGGWRPVPARTRRLGRRRAGAAPTQ
jgi:transposase